MGDDWSLRSKVLEQGTQYPNVVTVNEVRLELVQDVLRCLRMIFDRVLVAR